MLHHVQQALGGDRLGHVAVGAGLGRGLGVLGHGVGGQGVDRRRGGPGGASRRRMAAMAVRPSMTGICMSIRIRSKCRARRLVHRLGPVLRPRSRRPRPRPGSAPPPGGWWDGPRPAARAWRPARRPRRRSASCSPHICARRPCRRGSSRRQHEGRALAGHGVRGQLAAHGLGQGA